MNSVREVEIKFCASVENKRYGLCGGPGDGKENHLGESKCKVHIYIFRTHLWESNL